MHAILLTYFYWIIFTINYKAESLKEDEYLDANDRHVSDSSPEANECLSSKQRGQYEAAAMKRGCKRGQERAGEDSNQEQLTVLDTHGRERWGQSQQNEPD